MQTLVVSRNSYKKRSADEPESSRDSGEVSGSISEYGLLARSIDRLSFIAYTTITFVLLACLI